MYDTPWVRCAHMEEKPNLVRRCVKAPKHEGDHLLARVRTLADLTVSEEEK